MAASNLSPEETEALNKHGVFFKKRIRMALDDVPGLKVISEELGVTFGDTRVIDLLAIDGSDQQNHVLFIVECKRAYAVQKRWIFFHDSLPRYRCTRIHSWMGHNSVFALRSSAEPAVCSEGYEIDVTGKSAKADQNPIFRAASQLAAGYLGLIRRRQRDFEQSRTPQKDPTERYVPLLVTNAELAVVDPDARIIDLATGTVAVPPKAKIQDFVILNHPFPTPENMEDDFRDKQGRIIGRAVR